MSVSDAAFKREREQMIKSKYRRKRARHTRSRLMKTRELIELLRSTDPEDQAVVLDADSGLMMAVERVRPLTAAGLTLLESNYGEWVQVKPKKGADDGKVEDRGDKRDAEG
tara:strand:- start:327 stop:659 length:333 start_codon:yes stop_codon:yes gene_type:complete